MHKWFFLITFRKHLNRIQTKKAQPAVTPIWCQRRPKCEPVFGWNVPQSIMMRQVRREGECTDSGDNIVPPCGILFYFFLFYFIFFFVLSSRSGGAEVVPLLIPLSPTAPNSCLRLLAACPCILRSQPNQTNQSGKERERVGIAESAFVPPVFFSLDGRRQIFVAWDQMNL